MREVSLSISKCEITNITRKPIDPQEARIQHEKYAQNLRDLGYKIHLIEADETLPDSAFIEDTAVVLEELAVITHPGASSRRGETKAVSEALSIYRDLEFIGESGTLDGGDVLRSGKTLFVGKSCRSSAVGIINLRDIVEPHGYEVIGVPVTGCLHLKSAATLVDDNTLLVNPSWVDPADFGSDMELITVDPSEPYGANTLRVNGGLLYSISYPNTRRKLESRGLEVVAIDLSELAKAEGNISCCCIPFSL
jgi:dimethylargininase